MITTEYTPVLQNLTEADFYALWKIAYPNDILHLPHYWNEFKTANTAGKIFFINGHKKFARIFNYFAMGWIAAKR